jgi:hypothetical protein
VALIRGRTITGKHIWQAMLLGYFKQAVALHTDGRLPNPHQVNMNYIRVMTNAVKKYETIPKHKEMISDNMFHYIANLSSRASEDSLVHAITDWIALGCYTCFHKSEWCSNTIDNPNWGDQPNVLPIITEDFSFSSATGHCVHDVNATPNEAIIFTTMTTDGFSPTGSKQTRTEYALHKLAPTSSGERSTSTRPPTAPPQCTVTPPQANAS